MQSRNKQQGNEPLFANKVIKFYQDIIPAVKLPKDVEMMLPFSGEEVMSIVRKFYVKFFSDRNERIYVFGINPGRFGGGVTGIPFTDPLRLEIDCGIFNDFTKRGEISAEFIYKMIGAFGGPAEFYRCFFITAISPVGFIKDGLNLNYYDDKSLEKTVTPYIVETMKQQLNMGARKDVAVCLGTGKNLKYFENLNQLHNFFGRIVPLEHPRFIMQYRRKRLDEYIGKYITTLQDIL